RLRDLLVAHSTDERAASRLIEREDAQQVAKAAGQSVRTELVLLALAAARAAGLEHRAFAGLELEVCGRPRILIADLQCARHPRGSCRPRGGRRWTVLRNGCARNGNGGWKKDERKDERQVFRTHRRRVCYAAFSSAFKACPPPSLPRARRSEC